MPFDNLKSYVQAPVSIPGTAGLDPTSPDPNALLKQLLDKYVGSTPSTDNDSIQPDYTSPIDVAGAIIGAKLGGALVGGAKSAGSGITSLLDDALPSQVDTDPSVPSNQQKWAAIKNKVKAK